MTRAFAASQSADVIPFPLVTDERREIRPRAETRRVPGLVLSTVRRLRVHQTDQRIVVALAVALSVGFFVWYDAHGLIAAFGDARIREVIARRVVVSRTPGLAQFGATWLPFNAVASLPLIWNGVLFRSGIAGSIPSMLGFVVASLYLYRIGRLLTASRAAGWVAAGAFMLNPSLLYMQSTAMSETTALAALIVATYYTLKFLHSGDASDLAKCSAAVAVGTLIRYENWVLAFAFVPVIAYAGWRRRGYALAEAWTILYSLLAFAGCVAWVVYNAIIFHDPLLSFYYGQSSHKYYENTPASLVPARHNALLAFKLYGLTVALTVGWLLVALALLGLLVCMWRFRLRLMSWPVYLTLFPLGFYWLVLYQGVNTENLPQLGLGSYYNVRFGLLMVPAIALLLAVLVTAAPPRAKRVLAALILAVIALSSVVGFQHTPLALREARTDPLFQSGVDAQQAQWLSAHFKGGAVLIEYVNDASLMFYLLTKHNFPDHAFITDANGRQFKTALARPETSATWIVMNSDQRTLASQIWTTLHNRIDWRKYFALRATFHTPYGTTEFYERNNTRT